MSEAHRKKDDNHWESFLEKYAREGRLGRGEAPGKTGKWYTKYKLINDCPVFKEMKKGGDPYQRNLLGVRVYQCTCTYDHKKKKNTIDNPTAAATATITNEGEEEEEAPPQVVPLGDFAPLCKPTIPNNILLSGVRGRAYVLSGKDRGEYDLEVFGYVDGKCPHCNLDSIRAHSLNKSIKIIHTASGIPRWVLGIGMRCEACNGKGWQTYEATYMYTLQLWQRLKLNAVVVGASDGVDMDVIVPMRNGSSAAVMAKSCAANHKRKHSQLWSGYKSKCDCARKRAKIEVAEYPPVNPSHYLSARSATKSMIRDFLACKDGLIREMATNVSEHALAIDHQYKITNRLERGAQSFTVVGDGGVVLGYYVVPDANMDYVNVAMREIVTRHGASINEEDHRVIEQGGLPRTIYVDRDCCNGRPDGRNDDNKWFWGMLKKLDAFHLINRVMRETNSEHPRKGRWSLQLSSSIFTASKTDTRSLQAARAEGNITNLNSKQKKADRKYISRVIVNPPRIVSKILLSTKTQIGLDRQARLQFENTGGSCQDLPTGHYAYPLLSKKVLNCVKQQSIHILNGCVHDEESMMIAGDTINYRGTGIQLQSFRSARGSSKVETFHSFMDRKFYGTNRLRRILFDARALWSVTNFNRERLRTLGKFSLPAGVAPSEVTTDELQIVSDTNLLFGFGYYGHVVNEVDQAIDDAVLDKMVEDDILDVPIPIPTDDSAGEDTDTGATTSASSLVSALTAQVPEGVNFDTLNTIGDALDNDVDWLSARTETMQPGVEDEDLVAAGGGNPSFTDCLAASDVLGAELGIDVDYHFAGHTERFSTAEGARGRRNVGLRRARSGQPAPVRPDFTDEMRTKWLEIWGSANNPHNSTISFKKWYERSKATYQLWRIKKLDEARTTDQPLPALHEVDFEGVKRWVADMKRSENEVVQLGIFNDDSRELSERTDSFIHSTEREENTLPFEGEDGIGVAINRSTLSVVADSAERPALYVMPNRDAVNAALNGNTSKKRKAPPVDEELQRRIQVAGVTMKRLDIEKDPVTGKKRRCRVCQKFWTDFDLGGVKHKQIAAADGDDIFNFCPLADAHSMYEEHMKVQAIKKSIRNKGEHQRRVKRKQSGT